MVSSAATETGNGKCNAAERWPELQGEHSWDGLLDPLDIDLRKSIISYGELVSATGYGFNKEKRSPHYGLCMYGRGDLLTKSGVADAAHYSVTKFVYATAELLFGLCKETTWMGYVAVATDEGVAELGRRDIVVAWRGTLTEVEAIKDILEFVPAPAKSVLGTAAAKYPSALVHSGFLSVYTTSNANSELGKTSARDQVFEEVKRLVELYKDEEISITVVGHSLGASLSILNAVDLVSNGVNSGGGGRPPCLVTAVVFACPHVGNQSFKDAFDSFEDHLKALHVKNKIDPVPEFMAWLPDLGVTLPIDTSLSPCLKDPKKTAHELECYQHGVAGVQTGGGFDLAVDRDPALLNRAVDALKDEYPVPASWWVPEYKSMVKNDKGKWELNDFEEI
ncbi:unnamed protein product [Urochloa decumbens]|uniref:Phospholipase A1 n=1 Tax=Urochloa decumbens TaxID=240449 RepID=A0ABC8WBY2_9POAL